MTEERTATAGACAAVDVSVAVCTYNRAQSLAGALRSLREMTVPATLTLEVLVVDNNSDDATKDVVAEFARNTSLTVRYVFEPVQGVSQARNRAVREARGRIIAFIDDDVVVERSWLGEVMRAFEQTDTVCVGGRVLVPENVTMPKWWNRRYDGVLGAWDRGDSPVIANGTYWGMIGICANMSFRSSVFERYGFFRAELGRVGRNLLMGEETEFYGRLRSHGERAAYWPSAVVYLCHDDTRFTRQYLRRWYFRIGQWFEFWDRVRPHEEVVRMFGVPRWMYRVALVNFGESVAGLLRGRRAQAFDKQLEFVQFVGYVWGAMQRRRVGKSRNST